MLAGVLNLEALQSKHLSLVILLRGVAFGIIPCGEDCCMNATLRLQDFLPMGYVDCNHVGHWYLKLSITELDDK